MKRDNKLVSFAILVLIITIIAICLVAGTYAKYTSQVTGEDSVTVAKWSIEANDNEITTDEDQKVTFDLFSTIKDSDGGVEEDVKADLIAPGTTGSFDVKVENLSQVNAKYSIEFVLTNTLNIPLEFSIDNGQTWKSTLADANVTDKDIAMESGTETINVQWRWPFDGDHTTIGTQAQTATEVKVEANIKVDQAD